MSFDFARRRIPPPASGGGTEDQCPALMRSDVFLKHGASLELARALVALRPACRAHRAGPLSGRTGIAHKVVGHGSYRTRRERGVEIPSSHDFLATSL